MKANQQFLLPSGGRGVSSSNFPAAIYLEVRGWLLWKLHLRALPQKPETTSSLPTKELRKAAGGHRETNTTPSKWTSGATSGPTECPEDSLRDPGFHVMNGQTLLTILSTCVFTHQKQKGPELSVTKEHAKSSCNQFNDFHGKYDSIMNMHSYLVNNIFTIMIPANWANWIQQLQHRMLST